jgi:hypothetical protein
VAQAAERFFQRTSSAIERLIADRASHPKVGRDSHHVPITRFPFVLVYRIRSENDGS